MTATILQLAELLKKRQWKLVTAESCTGGGLSYAITSIPGSSDWFERGFVTYSNKAKEEMLGVKSETLKTYGAVSEETAREMAEGALRHSHADVSIAITGIAGPSGGSAEKPVGLVYFGLAIKTQAIESYKEIFKGDRESIRKQAIEKALQLLRFP